MFLLAYGEFVYSLSLVNKNELQPATVGLYGFVGADYSEWGNAMAFASMIVAPVILIFLVLLGRIVRGLTAGASNRLRRNCPLCSQSAGSLQCQKH